MLDSKNISELEKKIIVENNPFPHSIIENFLPTDIITRAEDEFINFKKVYNSGNKLFQKTKKGGDFP